MDALWIAAIGLIGASAAVATVIVVCNHRTRRKHLRSIERDLILAAGMAKADLQRTTGTSSAKLPSSAG